MRGTKAKLIRRIARNASAGSALKYDQLVRDLKKKYLAMSGPERSRVSATIGGRA